MQIVTLAFSTGVLSVREIEKDQTENKDRKKGHPVVRLAEGSIYLYASQDVIQVC